MGDIKEAIVRSCPLCEQAEREWKEHPPVPEAARADAVAVSPPGAPIGPPTPPAPQVVAAAPTPAGLPTEVDLRPRLLELGLGPRAQGARGTCSIFTTCEAIEFSLAVGKSKGTRMSPEYLNWAGGQAAGRPSDGNFFHNALAGFERLGMCTEELMPYQVTFDAARGPSAAAAEEAVKVREESKGKVVVRWIVPWQSARFGVGDEQFAEIKRVLASGYPVAAGSGHSRLLVGFRDDVNAAGGGKFMTEDSALARFNEMTYEFVRKQVADVFWVEGVGAGKVGAGK